MNGTTNLIGHKFGMMRVIKKLGPKNGHIYWECLCNCGNIRKIHTGNIKQGKTISCGCYKKNNKGKDHKNFKGVGDLSASFVSNIKYSAYARNIDFKLSVEYLWKLYLIQNRLCALSGIEIYFPETSIDCSNGNKTCSLDRIDSSIGYIEGNVQWVHKDVNIMKHKLSNKYFISMCNKISNFNEVES